MMTSRLGPGGAGGVVPPVPIPNTVVKRSSADDTAWATAWDNRPVPGPSLTLFCSVEYSSQSARTRPGGSRASWWHSAEHVDNRRVVGSVTIQRRDRQEAMFLSNCPFGERYKGKVFLTIPMESLILAQDKRWRRA